MDVWKLVFGSAALWAITGCHTPQAITALERECRMLEDQIYMLEDELSRAESALEACQSRSAESPCASASPSRSSSANDRLRLPSLGAPKEPGRDGNGKPPSDARGLRLPEVETGKPLPPGVLPDTLAPPFRRPSPSTAPGSAPDNLPGRSQSGLLPQNRTQSAYRRGASDLRSWPNQRGLARREQPRRLLPPGEYPAARDSGRADSSAGSIAAGSSGVSSAATDARDASSNFPAAPHRDRHVMPVQAIALDPRADNTRADRITLNRAMTGGYDRDAHFGDAGIAVLVEPRDAHGRLVPAAGPVSVVLLDRSRSGDAARVARWDFSAEQIATLYRKTPYGEGIYLEMPWPGSPPERSHLHLFVRYTTQDGRNLEASCEVDVALPSQRRQAWTPITSAAVESRTTQTASGWREKPRSEEPSPIPPSGEKSSLSSGTSPAVPASHVEALPPEASPRAMSRPSEIQRPIWSPLRPDQ